MAIGRVGEQYLDKIDVKEEGAGYCDFQIAYPDERRPPVPDETDYARKKRGRPGDCDGRIDFPCKLSVNVHS